MLEYVGSYVVDSFGHARTRRSGRGEGQDACTTMVPTTVKRQYQTNKQRGHTKGAKRVQLRRRLAN
jgi:hypothetical protein